MIQNHGMNTDAGMTTDICVLIPQMVSHQIDSSCLMLMLNSFQPRVLFCLINVMNLLVVQQSDLNYRTLISIALERPQYQDEHLRTANRWIQRRCPAVRGRHRCTYVCALVLFRDPKIASGSISMLLVDGSNLLFSRTCPSTWWFHAYIMHINHPYQPPHADYERIGRAKPKKDGVSMKNAQAWMCLLCAILLFAPRMPQIVYWFCLFTSNLYWLAGGRWAGGALSQLAPANTFESVGGRRTQCWKTAAKTAALSWWLQLLAELHTAEWKGCLSVSRHMWSTATDAQAA